MRLYQTRHDGVVIEKDGKYWGVQYEDGHSREEGWGPIERAGIHNPKYLHYPAMATYKGSPYVRELEQGRILPVQKQTVYTVVEEV